MEVEARLSVCLGISGSVAAVKAPELVRGLLAAGMNVDAVVSESAVKLMKSSYRGEEPWKMLLGMAERAAGLVTKSTARCR